MTDEDHLTAKVLRAVVSAAERPELEVAPHSRFTEDLGFDSLRMATLTIMLEQQLGEMVLLNDWIAEAEDPGNLTVRSLIEYLNAVGIH